MDITNFLTPEELAHVKRTMEHFLRHPDYATGEERGLTFEQLQYGEPIPMELVLRDWRSADHNGQGKRVYMQGDCYPIYVKLYETGIMKGVDLARLKNLQRKAPKPE